MRKRFFKTAQKFLVDIARPEDPSGVMVFSPMGNASMTALHVILAKELAKNNWGVVFLDGAVPLPNTGSTIVHRYESMITPLSYLRRFLTEDNQNARIRNRWNIDFNRELVECEGVNYFFLVYSVISRMEKSYHLDFEEDKVQSLFKDVLASLDAALTVCHRLREDFAENDIPVRFSGPEPLYATNGVFNFYCSEIGSDQNMEFIDMAQAYENLFRPSRKLQFSNFVIENITRQKLFSAHQIRDDSFSDWKQTNSKISAAQKTVQQLVGLNRTGATKPNPEAQSILARCLKFQSAGGRVVCLFGRLIYDLGVPDDSGTAHENMESWVIDSINAVKGQNVLLLIKPHIAEYSRPAWDAPNELFVDLIPKDRPKNVIVLDPYTFNLNQLLPHLDLGLVWRSTAALELAYSGIPTIVAGKHQYHSEVINLPQPKSSEEYHQMIRDSSKVPMDPRIAERIALYFEYMKSEDNFFHFSYATLGIHKKLPPYPKWNKKSLKEYLLHGDPAISRLCSEHIL